MDTSPAQANESLFRRVFRPLIAGALATLPLALTLFVVLWLANFLQRFLGPGSLFGRLLGTIGLQFVTSPTVAYLIGLAGALMLIYLFGLLVQSRLKNRWEAFVDALMRRLPLVNTVYDSSKKLVGVFDRQRPSEIKKMSPVMCYFGGKGGTAVMALMPSPELIRLDGQDYHAVLIPTAPVPFGGALLYVPSAWVEPLDIGFDGLFNVYMSMGVTSRDYLRREGED